MISRNPWISTVSIFQKLKVCSRGFLEIQGFTVCLEIQGVIEIIAGEIIGRCPHYGLSTYHGKAQIVRACLNRCLLWTIRVSHRSFEGSIKVLKGFPQKFKGLPCQQSLYGHLPVMSPTKISPMTFILYTRKHLNNP